uniref:Uncharacterized protein n=1 Tax=Engystomops pustulosus TaxID=76066 RepID=A0AAV6YPZ2_ENGPU|nr:hypothetical protein GDO81_020848 [Engystomops pustulosus]
MEWVGILFKGLFHIHRVSSRCPIDAGPNIVQISMTNVSLLTTDSSQTYGVLEVVLLLTTIFPSGTILYNHNYRFSCSFPNRRRVLVGSLSVFDSKASIAKSVSFNGTMRTLSRVTETSILAMVP